MDFKIISEKLKYNSFLKIKEGTIEMIDSGKRHNRERVDRPDASVVLIRNVEQNTIVLVEQFRYPTGKKILEAMAGKVDKGESPLDAAIRETHNFFKSILLCKLDMQNPKKIKLC
ncbi:MAG: NUDIX hydrolase [Salibacter sp.]|uniref:NUDIX hydrolase n=1 Tax=Salibacter sp. TaxID=2010995 RepID=UPI0028707E50|nr:NUDIX hydrolase [Salibacter sp.]MDR9399245.1 NUDIX hydrolase [Salibacter sp.]